MNASDNELVRRTAAGDRCAFEQLVRQWESRVADMLGRLGVPDADVSDLSQEVFLRVLTGAASFRHEATFATWLFRVVVNLARDRARRQRPAEPLRDRSPVAPADDPGRELAQRELAAAVETALARLPAHQREALVLKHFGGLTTAGVAEIVGVPVSTLKSRLAAGLKQMRRELARIGIDQLEDIS